MNGKTLPHLLSLLLAAPVIFLSGLPLAHAVVGADSSLVPSGAIATALQAEGMLILTRSDGSFGCSGSLLAGGQYVLTAAHCVSGDQGTATTSSISISFQSGTVTTAATTYYVDPAWSGNLAAGNDLALIKLSSPITTLTGYSLYQSSAQGAQFLLAGYGLTGTGTAGATDNTFGSLHYGYNQYDSSGSIYSTQVSSAVYLFDFDDGQSGSSHNLFGSTGLGADEALIARGDSGGGSFIDVDGIWELAGVHSFIGSTDGTLNSSFDEYAGDISVAANAAWLDSYLAAPIPEPQSYALLLAGLSALGLLARNKKAR